MAWFKALRVKFQWYLNLRVVSILCLIILTHSRVRKYLILLLRVRIKALVLTIVQDGPLVSLQGFRTLLQFKMVLWFQREASRHLGALLQFRMVLWFHHKASGRQGALLQYGDQEFRLVIINPFSKYLQVQKMHLIGPILVSIYW